LESFLERVVVEERISERSSQCADDIEKRVVEHWPNGRVSPAQPAQDRSAATNVGFAPVIGLAAAGLDLLLDGALRHEVQRYRVAVASG
jgi:hypothetical protein